MGSRGNDTELFRNTLNPEFLFVNKTASSRSLSNSRAAERTSIFSHVKKGAAGASHNRKRFRLTETTLSKAGNDGSAHPTADPRKADNSEEKSTQHSLSQDFRLWTPTNETKVQRCIVPYDRLNLKPQVQNEAEMLHSISQPFESEQYLDFFRTRTALEWSGWADERFWNDLILKASFTEPSLKHALASIGALHKSLETNDENSKPVHRNNSLKQCNRAIRIITKNASGTSLTILLFSCIMFMSLQMFEDVAMAHKNLRSGLMMIKAAKQQHETGKSPISRSDREILFKYIKPLFERYVFRVCSMIDLVGSLRTVKITQLATETFPEVPQKFQSLHEARDSLETICNWTCAIAKGLSVSPDQMSETNELPKRWLTAIDTFADGNDLQNRNLTSFHLLKAAQIASILLIKTMSAATEIEYDQYAAEFGEIVKLYQRSGIGEKASSASECSFGFDGGVIDTMVFVGSHFRDPQLRRQMLKYLALSRRQEGTMVAQIAAIIGTAQMEIEEGDIPPHSYEDIPESRRVRMHEVKLYPKYGLAQTYFIHAPYQFDSRLEDRWFRLPNFEPSAEPTSANAGLGPCEVLGCGYTRSEEEDLTQSSFMMSQCHFFFPIPKA